MKRKTVQIILAITILATSSLNIPSVSATSVQISEEDLTSEPIDTTNVSIAHSVSYSWTGLPDGHNLKLPTDGTRYVKDSTVKMDTSYYKDKKVIINNDEYSFEGWYVDGIANIDNEFLMPNNDVVIKGVWSKSNNYKVSYSWTGLPNDYSISLPVDNTKYRKDDEVRVDSYYPKDRKVTINGIEYIFSGWKSDDLTINYDSFKMPNKDVTLKGEWRTAVPTYKVEYKWKNLPKNAKVALPETKDYIQDTMITVDEYLKKDTQITVGNETFVFLGWFCDGLLIQDGKFKMPRENVFFIGEWKNINEKNEFNVMYSWTGLPENNNVVIPENTKVKETEVYMLNQTYVQNSKVIIDNKEYFFSGWRVWNDIAELKNNQFVMPSNDVVLIGAWTEVPQTVQTQQPNNTNGNTTTNTNNTQKPSHSQTTSTKPSNVNNTNNNTSNNTTTNINNNKNNNININTNNNVNNTNNNSNINTSNPNNVKTGDDNSLFLFANLFTFSIIGMFLSKRQKYKNKKV